ncbi:hypothetical protein KXX57_004648 [Aspergillus fumigatus]|nr:hypothetical protein KXX57_004648 [Aspergillus fumigatus]
MDHPETSTLDSHSPKAFDDDHHGSHPLDSASDCLSDETVDYLEPLELTRINTYRLQQKTTVGSTRGPAPRETWLPMGAGKEYPPLLPDPETYVVEFDGAEDPLHPYNWSMTRRIFLVCILCYGTFAGSFASAVFSAAIASSSKEFHISQEVGSLGVTLYVLGFAAGPTIWAPASELIGRRWPLSLGLLGCGIFTVGCATGKDVQTLMICRFFAGLFAASPISVVPAVFADLFNNAQRGIVMSIFCMAVFIGPFAAPFVGGFITMSALGWRWTMYISAIMVLLGFVLVVLFLDETYAPVILVRKAATLRRQTHNWGIHAKQDEVEVDFHELVRNNFTRPLKMLFTEPILLLISLYISFIYGLIYALLGAYPVVFQRVYGMNMGEGGLAFVGLIIGELLGGVFILFLQGSYIKKLAANGDVPVPEWRLPPAIVGGITFAAGMFWFGWTGYTSSIHWMVPISSGVLTGFGIFCIFLQCFNYIVDCYPTLAASTIAANTILRSAVGCAFPLFSRQMMENLGVQWAGTMLGCIAAVMVPIPIAFMVYGPWLRIVCLLFGVKMYKNRVELTSVALFYLSFLVVFLLSQTLANGALLATAPVNRALPNAPDGYTPQGETCPSKRPSIRNATALSSAETSWLKARRNNTKDALKAFLSRVDLGSFNGSDYIANHSANASALPNIGIAVSGGGYRALMNGGGALQAFDNRTTNSTHSGQLGGILQSATYLSGLSGGSWLVGSIYMNNFSDVSSLQDNGSVWQFQDSIFSGPTQSTTWDIGTVEYYSQLLGAVDGKSNAGYEVSITDYWGRSLSYQLINASEGGVGYTWSSIALSKDFQAGTMPMPLVIADGRAPGEILVPANTTVFEFNPWEFGSWDKSLSAFVSLEFLGSNFSKGTLATGEKCVRGFDNAGFIMGTSSSLFNQAFLQMNNTDAPSVVKDAISAILGKIGSENNDIAVYKPNPFYRYASQSKYTSSPSLTLVDGGEDLQNIPLDPLLQPQRHVDVILAVDSSADTTTRWPNGTSLVATYERNVDSSQRNSSLPFPSVPDQNTFVNLGLNNRPTFFGCNSSNATGAPLVVYILNAPYIYPSNVSTFDLQYNTSERNAIIENGYDVATLGNGTVDSNWPACLACAILSRSFERTNTTVPKTCSTCFKTYCWNGTINATTPGDYYPTLKLH